MAKYSGKRSRLFPPEVEKNREHKQDEKIEKKGFLKRIADADIGRRFRNSPGIEIPSLNFSFSDFGSKSIVFLGVSAGLILAFIVILIMDFQRVQSLAHFRPSEITRIYDKNDVLISELFRQRRDIVQLEDIPQDLINAIIAIEDNEFYNHYGINLKGIVRAFFVNLSSGRIRQGGSTITQQLAKILMTSGERNIYRKIKEAFIAIMMEATYSKNEILALYLNQIFLGHGAHGVEAASQLYFDKSVSELNLAESSLIAALPSAPNRFSPIRNPRLAIARHKVVLVKMAELGFVSIEEAEEAYLDFWPDYLVHVSEIPPTRSVFSARVDKAPWVTEYVRRQLVNTYGNEMVYEKGLSVYTTIDLQKQLAAQDALKSQLDKQRAVSARLSKREDQHISENYTDRLQLLSLLFDLPDFKRKGSREGEKFNIEFREKLAEELEMLNLLAGLSTVDTLIDKYKETYFDSREFQQVEGAVIAINQSNGYIEALVGGSEFSSINQLIRPVQARRQPGSAIKPLLYAAAIESGNYTAATTILDSPIIYLDTEGGDWIPENYERDFYGFLRLRRALALSINVCSIRIADSLGIDYTKNFIAKLLRFNETASSNRIPRNFSIALGSMDVTPLELARAYAIIANGGRDLIPFSVRYIEDREGNILENREESVNKRLREMDSNGSRQVISPETAQIMISLMQSAINEGTGRSAGIGRPAAGKTGTTNNWRDAWFVGFTPEVTSAVWFGYDRMGLTLGENQSGGAIAAPMWSNFMRDAHRGIAVSGFPVYAQLVEKTICRRTGLLPSPGCSERMTEYFAPSAVPEENCSLCRNIGRQPAASQAPKENISGRHRKSIIDDLKEGDDSILNHSFDDFTR